MTTSSMTPPSRPESAKTNSTGASSYSARTSSTPSTPTWPSRDSNLPKQVASQDHKLSSVGKRENNDEECASTLLAMWHDIRASQHATRRSSSCPLGDDQVSRSSIRHRQLNDHVMRQDVGNVPYTNGEERLQQAPQRTFSVHNILNPREPRLPASAGNSFLSAKRPFEDITPEDTRPQYPHLHPLTGAPTGPLLAMSDRGRLHSQPLAFPGTQAPLSTSTSSHAPGRTQPPLVHSQTSYSPNMQAGRSFLGPGPPSESASPWSETLRRHGMGGPHFGVEGQQAMLTLPGSEAPIPVNIDFSQASKKAYEKRQRNAVASTRHRRKKKIMQEENSKQLQELRDERRLMEIRIEELIQQRDFYREDRNRLRDIVAQTPSITGHAAGPPNPTISTSNSYAETGSLASGPSGSTNYGDVLSNERSTQRRRTDDHPEYSLPPYRFSASGHPSASLSGLPPMPMPGYGGPSWPSSAASSASGKRLPLLRVMEGQPSTGPPPGPGVQEQDPRTGQWVPVQPRVPEIGWARRDTHRRP
ncbi:hypothetical protein FPRO04_14515 [Fusarium proliferatum]|nr:hypothetical protein FPRO04_14515 [Fusarium proliferatum]